MAWGKYVGTNEKRKMCDPRVRKKYIEATKDQEMEW